MKLTRRQFLTGVTSALALGLLNSNRFLRHLSASLEEDKNASLLAEDLQFTVDCDWVLKNGLIVDGSGRPAFKGNVGVKGDRIVAVGDFSFPDGARIIQAEGLVIAPGFIDLHTHTEDYMLHNGRAEMLLLQGVTTHIGGNCGTSVTSLPAYWESLGPLGINFGLLCGYGTLRQRVLGSSRRATAQEITAMQREVASALEAGAFGLSVGLSYWPQSLATTAELVELCRVVAQYGGFYATHIRSEEDGVLLAVEEAIAIGRQAGVPVQYSHIKTAQRRNWGKMARVLSLLERAREEGLDITADVYVYTFSSLDVGSSRESISEEDMLLALKHPLVMIASDTGLRPDGRASHPRAYGNYPRVLGLFVRERKVLTLEEAIHKMTYLPARRLGLTERGALVPGARADIIAFDPVAISDRSTRENPNILATGVRYVFVNGQLAVKEGIPTGVLAGQALRKTALGTAGISA